MDWRDNINTIKEIYRGHYQIILDFATNAFLNHVIDERYKYVWVNNHKVSHYHEWKHHQLPLSGTGTAQSINVLARGINFDFVVPTIEFEALLPNLGARITLVQLNELPPYYLDNERVKGKTRYDLLKKECDYLFEIDIPSATDYGTLISADKDWLQGLLDSEKIDWKNLP